MFSINLLLKISTEYALSTALKTTWIISHYKLSQTKFKIVQILNEYCIVDELHSIGSSLRQWCDCRYANSRVAGQYWHDCRSANSQVVGQASQLRLNAKVCN